MEKIELRSNAPLERLIFVINEDLKWIIHAKKYVIDFKSFLETQKTYVEY